MCTNENLKQVPRGRFFFLWLPGSGLNKKKIFCFLPFFFIQQALFLYYDAYRTLMYCIFNV